jgi:hypothetical protein
LLEHNEIESLDARKSQQVISGAGLYMSRSAIERLPPFMSFATLTTWVDDHLKRRLHEALDHLEASDLEHVDEALFRQNRHPEGITEEQIQGAWKGDGDEYLARLFRGCVLHLLTVRLDGTMGAFAEAVEKVIPPREAAVDEMSLKREFEAAARQAASIVLDVWGEADYDCILLNKWAKGQRQKLDQLLSPLVKDAVAYVRLVSRWYLYVGAVMNLTPINAWWLFRQVDAG